MPWDLVALSDDEGFVLDPNLFDVLHKDGVGRSNKIWMFRYENPARLGYYHSSVAMRSALWK